MKTYSLTDPAKRDVLKIWDYIREQNDDDERAEAFIDRLYDAFDMLAEHPYAALRRERLKGARAFPVDGYFVVYEIVGDVIEILRVSGAHEGVLKDL